MAERSLAALGEPRALQRDCPFLGGLSSDATLASICLLATLVHGCDIAQGAYIDHWAGAVDAAWAYARHAIGDDQRQSVVFAEPLSNTPAANTFIAHLAHLGRRA
ncbi:hypothetical protein [Actinomadura macra]|uniref:hypothetical protein n=1 Tax=Actinomadura macra TaxID=46164 RepID=UPI00082FB27B|nr:hypothetical protein [Actinomadura macra]